MSSILTHDIVDLTGAISETFTPVAADGTERYAGRVLSVSLKFSDVITQDTVYIRKLNSDDDIIAEVGFAPADESVTATHFTWEPLGGSLYFKPGDKINIAFANNDARALTTKESNIVYRVY